MAENLFVIGEVKLSPEAKRALKFRERFPVDVNRAAREDLLLAVREFLDAWNTGTREDVLAVASPDFREVLADLPAGRSLEGYILPETLEYEISGDNARPRAVARLSAPARPAAADLGPGRRLA